MLVIGGRGIFMWSRLTNSIHEWRSGVMLFHPLMHQLKECLGREIMFRDIQVLSSYTLYYGYYNIIYWKKKAIYTVALRIHLHFLKSFNNELGTCPIRKVSYQEYEVIFWVRLFQSGDTTKEFDSEIVVVWPRLSAQEEARDLNRLKFLVRKFNLNNNAGLFVKNLSQQNTSKIE